MSTSETRREQIIRFVQERQTTLASGLAALLIIVVGFLIFNFFLNINKDTTPQDEVTTSEESSMSADIALSATPTPSTTPNPENSKTGEVSPGGSAQVVSDQEYVVTRGETLGTIAQKVYGDSSKWDEIAKANNLTNPNKIHPGNKLLLPKAESGSVASSTTIKETPATGIGSGGNVEYVVTTGDTLWQIAYDFYGSGFEWYKIRDANGDKVRLTSSGKPLITAGQHLIIP